MSALRLARAATGRDRVVKFGRLLPRPRRRLPGGRRLGRGDDRRPRRRPACPPRSSPTRWSRPTTTSSAAAELFARHGREIAAVFVEPIAGNMGLVPPRPGFLAGLRELCDAPRRAARLRRGDDRLPRRLGRRAGALRRAARPDDAGQGDRRRAAHRRLRRPRATDASASRRPGRSTRRARSPATRSRWRPGSRRSSELAADGGAAYDRLESASARGSRPASPTRPRRAGVPCRVHRRGSMLGFFLTGGEVLVARRRRRLRPRRASPASSTRLLADGVHLPPSPVRGAVRLDRPRRRARSTPRLRAFDARLAGGASERRGADPV